LLAPNRPSVLFHRAWYISIKHLFDTVGSDENAFPEEVTAEVLSLFRRVLELEPDQYPHLIYNFLLDVIHAGPERLLEITPKTIVSQQKLLNLFWARRLFPEALQSADEIHHLLGMDPNGQEFPPYDFQSEEFYLCLKSSFRRSLVLQMLGRADDWRREFHRYLSISRTRCPYLFEDGSRYTRLNRFIEAKKCYEDCLEADRNNVDAMLNLLEISSLPSVRRHDDDTSGTLKRIIRVLRLRPSLSPEDCERLTTILSRLTPDSPTEHLVFKLVEAQKALGCGQEEEAARIFKALLIVEEPTFQYWQQRHLLHSLLGKTLELSDSREAAIGEYWNALKLAPSHRESLSRLVALGEENTPFNPGAVLPEEAQKPAESAESSETGSIVSESETPDLNGESPLTGGTEVIAPVQGSASVAVDAMGMPLQTAGEMLAELTPEVSWGVDFSGKFNFLGLSVTAEEITRIPVIEGVEMDEFFPVTSFSSGFWARYYWEVEEDLESRDYRVHYHYFDANRNVFYRINQRLFPEVSETMARNLDGGIGTVLVQWHFVPLPLDAARGVRIMARQRIKMKGSRPHPPLRAISGRVWLTLGLEPKPVPE